MNLERLSWIAFGVCWLSIMLYCNFLSVWFSNIPDELYYGGYIDEYGNETALVYIAAYLVPAYVLGYLVFIITMRVMKRIGTGRMLLLFMPMVAMVLILLAAWLQAEAVDPIEYHF